MEIEPPSPASGEVVLKVGDQKGGAKALLTGVTEVESFDDGQVVLSTHGGRLVITGAGLHVSSLVLEEGKLSLEGTIDGMHYEGGAQKRGGFLRRALR